MSNKLFITPTFIKTPSQNGVGRYVGQLQRIVFKFCKSSGSNRGMREFIESGLMDFTKENPGTVVYLKPRRHRSAIISAEYLNGDKQWISCRNFTNEEIQKWVNLLRTQSRNATGTRLRKMWHTDHPSIQGPWTPYTFRDSSLNLVKFPDTALSTISTSQSGTTERLLELFQKQRLEAGNDELEQRRAE